MDAMIRFIKSPITNSPEAQLPKMLNISTTRLESFV